MDSIIKLENVNLWYDREKPSEVWALKNINLEIKKGEYIAFFGPSGCGKTTLLYAISGIESVNDGKVMINNRDIAKFSRQELAIYRQIGIGIVFQQFNLIPSLTVLGNVALPMAFLGISPKKREEEALRLLDRLGIKDLAQRFPFELSGGQQQRVGIARALANNPPIIVADEPLGNLDSANAQKVLEFLRELNEKDGRTIIMVTHEAWSLKDVKRIFFMKDGEILKAEESKPATVAKAVSEHFYKELSPEMTVTETAARTLSNLLLRGYSIDEIKRFEFFLSQRFTDHIDSETFKKVLDRPFSEGGLGLWKQKAKKIASYVDEIIEHKREADEIYKELEQNPQSPLVEEIEKIRGWLLKDYRGKISTTQKIRFNEIVSERLRSIIDAESFKKIIALSQNKFGVGLSFRTSQKIAERLETVLKNENHYE